MEFQKLTTTAANTGKLALVAILDIIGWKLSQAERPGLYTTPGICRIEDLTSEALDVTPWGFAHLLGSVSVP
jgi:hypothetical protein